MSPPLRRPRYLGPRLTLPPFLERNAAWQELRDAKMEARRLIKEQQELSLCRKAGARLSTDDNHEKSRLGVIPKRLPARAASVERQKVAEDREL